MVVAVVLGALLVVTSALAHRDARQAARVVAERQGIGLLHRAEAVLHRPVTDSAARAVLATVLEANRALGMSYVAILDGDSLGVVAEAGHPTLAPALPTIGSPLYATGRVRMIGGGGPRPAGPPPFGEPPGFGDARPLGPPPPLPPGLSGPPPHPGPGHLPPGQPPHPRRLMLIEFEPIASQDAIRRSLVALILSSGAAALLVAAAAVLWRRARRTAEVERRLAAQEHLASLGEMSAVLAHEIRNPLAALKGHAQLLAERITESPEVPRVQRVVDEALRLEKLTTGLLEFARSGRIDAAPADPVAVARDAAAATEPQRVDFITDGAPTSVVLDAARVRQVLINLLDNALAVTSPDARVVATIQAVVGGGVRYSVRDGGPGVPVADRERLFQPFFTTKTRGTGLGLAVARRIVALHGGTVGFADAPGGGTVFHVELPGAATDAPQATSPGPGAS